jgi:hypothetical protein
LVPEVGDPFLRVQRLDDGGPGCHLDVHADDVRAMRDLATSLGATTRQPPMLLSPAGLVFCIVAHRGEAHRPPPQQWPEGHRSLVDQLSIDIPYLAYERETAFWAALTGWERRPGSRPELSYLARPPGMPLRFLLQRLDEGRPGATPFATGPSATGTNGPGTNGAGPCRAHLDIACDVITAEQERHKALGAVHVRTMPLWATLRGPTGHEYCITSRDPVTGTLPR